METKICGRCKELKPTGEFYRSTRDGHRSECKVCHKILRDESTKTGYRKEYMRWYVRRPGKSVKRMARQYLNLAVQTGVITRESCSTCGEPQGQAHHPSYDEPLMVVWLCRKCHRQLHERIRRLKEL